MIKIKTALISVSDKKGLIPFAKKLHEFGVSILSTGGTANQLREAGIPVEDVSTRTGFPEMLDGRVKTLHPKIHGGLLALRDQPKHMEQIAKHGIDLIDMVIVNLYPFEAVTRKKNVSLEEAIENIDIGGPSMLRSAAKNYKSVAVVCNPERYQEIIHEMDVNSGILPDTILYKLALEAFTHTAKYDTLISNYLQQRGKSPDILSTKSDALQHLPAKFQFEFDKVQDLRYGENPHQKAAFYKDQGEASGLSNIKQIHGKELSFNNILDLNAAIDFIKDFNQPAAVVIKHGNPTGVAQANTLDKAFKDAWSVDKISAFGGIIGLNKMVDQNTAKLINQSGFMECVIAPSFDPKAAELLKAKKNLRLIEINFANLKSGGYDLKRVWGGVLVQDRDELKLDINNITVPTKKKPTKAQLASIEFGWKTIKHVKSNAIILVKGEKTMGIGCGQTSRVESVKVAIAKAGKSARGAILVSDAFLPHIDNVQLAAKAGIGLIVQTGGSVADKDVIAQADKSKIAMVMTGVRHFKH